MPMDVLALSRAAAFVSDAHRIAVLTGAGVSAESGIPTFRGLDGLWNGRDPMSLATPEAFAADPALVWEFYNWRRDLVARAQPNPAHDALAALARRTTGLTLITQNVDRLHQRAGSPGVIELHGNLSDVRCTRCARTADRSHQSLSSLPRCERCGGLDRPAVVWFGEPLPPDTWRAAESAVRAADLLLVVGTSAVVYPAAGLVATAQRAGATIIEVNPDATPLTPTVDLALQGPAGAILPTILREPSTRAE
jgi:NAD-dependent deacetylase